MRTKLSILLGAVSLLPLALIAYLDITQTRARLRADSEALLAARAEQLAMELEIFELGYARAAAKLARLPDVHAFLTASKNPELRSILALEASVDPQVRGAAILDASGVVRLASEPAIEALDLSIRAAVREALRGAPAISEVYVAEPEVDAVPTIAFLHPVRDGERVVGVAALWIRASALWALMRMANESAGTGSFALLVDARGILVGRSDREEIEFHPTTALDPAIVEALVSEQRFGPKTRAVLSEVRALPEEHLRAARPVAHSKATVFFVAPEQVLLSSIGRVTRERAALAGGIALAVFLMGSVYLAQLIVDPRRTPERRAPKKLEDSRSMLAAIIDSSEDAIAGLSLDGAIISWNRGAEQIFGFAAEEVLGRSITVLGHPSGALAPHTARDVVRRRKDGSPIAVSIALSPVRDASGATIGASMIARDITERRFAEERVARAKERAESAIRELESFGDSVAHDLRAPLRGMNGFAQILLDEHAAQLDDAGRDALQEILLNAKKMHTLLDALLSLSRVSRSEVERERCSLSEIVEAEAKLLCEGQPSRCVDFRVEGELYAEVDPVLARVALHNLLSNAWKFTAHRKQAVIELGAVKRNGLRLFFLRDNGAGFDMTFAHKLFTPFQRLHTIDEFPGTGIGLATVQRIVQRHGGLVWAEGAVDRGATFYFTFDRTPGSAT